MESPAVPAASPKSGLGLPSGPDEADHVTFGVGELADLEPLIHDPDRRTLCPARRVPRPWQILFRIATGAGDRDRTGMASLEG